MQEGDRCNSISKLTFSTAPPSPPPSPSPPAHARKGEALTPLTLATHAAAGLTRRRPRARRIAQICIGNGIAAHAPPPSIAFTSNARSLRRSLGGRTVGGSGFEKVLFSLSLSLRFPTDGSESDGLLPELRSSCAVVGSTFVATEKDLAHFG